MPLISLSTPRRVRIAAYAGLFWAAFQTAGMIVSSNLTVMTAAINVLPVLILSLAALRSSVIAALLLAGYGVLRLYMAYPIVLRLFDEVAALPKHWWVAMVAIPFAFLWIAGAQKAIVQRRAEH